MPIRTSLRLVATALAVAFLSASTCPANPSRQREYAGNAGAPDAGALVEERCARDEECALTWMLPGGCCGGCSQRAVLRAELEQRERECAGVQSKCPAMPCAPPRFMPVAVCRGGRCAAARVSNE